MSDESKNLYAALIKAQASMGMAIKGSTNPAYKSKYADWTSVVEAVRGPLGDNGLGFLQFLTTTPDGIAVTTRLIHVSGESIETTLNIPVAQKTAQGYGSGASYGKRYSLSALLGVATDVDDDGNAASGRPDHHETTPAPKPTQIETANKLIKAFEAVGVSVAQLEGRLGHSVYAASDAEIADLRAYHAKKKEMAADPEESARLEVQRLAEQSLAAADVKGSTPQSEGQAKALLVASIFAKTIDSLRAAKSEVDLVQLGATFPALGLPKGELAALQRQYKDALLILQDKAREAKTPKTSEKDSVP